MNSGTSSLLLRPHPYRNEGPKGYMLRLAEANWMPVRELQLIGLIYEPQTLMNEGLLPLKELNPDLHRSVEYYSDLLFNKKRVWNHQHARFCSQCLAEDAFWRAEWELLFYDACATHGTWLIDRCSSCGHEISWNRTSLIRCQCSADLRAETPAKCSENTRALSEVLKNKITGHHSIIYSAPFSKTDVEQTQRIIRYLGTYMDEASGKNPLKIPQAGLMSRSWSSISLAAEIVFNWPNNLYLSLENIQSKSASIDKPTLNTVFGYAYHYLYKGLTGAAFEELRNAFENWIGASWKGGLAKRNKRLATLILERAAWIPANLACDMLGISHQRLKYLIREGVLEGEEYLSEKGRSFVMVRRDNLEVIKHNLSGEIDMTAAGALLGLGKKRMRQLLRLIFPESRKSGLSSSAPWTVSRFEINKLLALADELPILSIPDEGSVTLNHILRYWAWTADDLGALIYAVRSSELIPENVLDGVVGISGWIFNENMLKAWKAKAQQGFGIWLNVTQAAKLIGIKQEVAYQLVHMNLIHAESKHMQPKGGLRIRRTEVEKFKLNYIFATEVAQRLGVSPRKAISILQKRSIEPISGPGIDEGRQVLYTRNIQLEKVFDEVENVGSLQLELHSRKLKET